MSKILKITDGDYKVQTGYAGRITLDTGSQAGEVVITGALIVLGDNTIVESETMSVKDNVIELNVGETGPGVTIKPDATKTSGIRIHRSAASRNTNIATSDVIVAFDEDTDPLFPSTAIADRGTVVFKYAFDNSLVSIKTNGISTGGANLGLINQGNGYITVSGTTNYELNAFNYTAWVAASSPRAVYASPNALITVVDDDIIPNSKALKDIIDASLYYYRSPLLSEGDTSVRTYDDSISGGLSRIVFTVNGFEKGQFNDNGLNVDNVRILSNTVSNTNAGQDLTLTAINSNVKVSGYLNLVDQISAPGDAGGVNKLYSTATTGPGDTGLYFVNTRSGENFEVTGAAPEELVSKKRAILFSMIF